jgi:thiamine kinase-like enzyme
MLPKFRLFWFSKSLNSKSSSQVAFLTADKKSIKLFDFINLEVLTINNNSMNLSKLEKNPMLQSQHFSTAIKSIEVNKDVLREEFIQGVPFARLNNSNKIYYFKKVIEQYRDYILNYNFEKSSAKLSDILKSYKIDYNEILSKMNLKKSPIFKDKYPILKVHGDFHGNNIICYNEDTVIIDFDFSNFNVFFIDIFYLVFSDAYLRDNKKEILLSKLISDLFDSLGMEYLKNYVDDYIAVSRLLIDLEISAKRGTKINLEEIIKPIK